MNKEEELIDRLIDLAFAEDIGDGDHTTLSCIPATAMGKSKLLIKEPGILAGIEIAKEVFRRFDPTMKVEVFINDGTAVKPGDVAMIVEGKIQSLLQTERLMLNIMQRMSGIATMTHKYAEQLKGTNTRVLDTRKTTPGMRILEKMAVKIGGGVNPPYRLVRYDFAERQPCGLCGRHRQGHQPCEGILQGKRQGPQDRNRSAQLRRIAAGARPGRCRPYHVRQLYAGNDKEGRRDGRRPL